MWMIPGRVAELLLLSWRVGRGMEELCWVTVWMMCCRHIEIKELGG